jgi:uncharacterized protein
MDLVIDNITLSPDQQVSNITAVLRSRFGIDGDFSFKILRKSLDARDSHGIVYRYRLMVSVTPEDAERLLEYRGVTRYEEKRFPAPVHDCRDLKVLIVGSGPAGLFCALRLIDYGAEVQILERGKQMEERLRDIAAIERNGVLDEESNVLFGEGGAGAYSDGKLNTRIHRPEIEWVFNTLIRFGAPVSVLYDARPHLGSDGIRRVVKNIRRYILESGSGVRFNEKVVDFIVRNNAVTGVRTASGNEFFCPQVVLAAGHSARDIYELLDQKGVAIASKGFAVGLRAEHPREHIDAIQYGTSKFKGMLPPAHYSLIWNNSASKRGIYSFCMCPGGMVINSSSEKDGLCINGMSNMAQDSGFSNSAIVVTVQPEDLGPGPLAGIEFQRGIERKAFRETHGQYYAPAQRITDFINEGSSDKLPPVSYRPGVMPTNLHRYMPQWISKELLEALRRFNRNMKGFISDHGVLLGVETRTSSPVRILRNDGYESVSHKGLYPAGEGAGYAGGIISSAVDGVKAADAIASNVKNQLDCSLDS